MDRRASLALIWATYCAIMIVAALIYIRIVPNPDQSLFDYMAWLHLHGVPYYSGSFETTWPGQLVFHELSVVAFGVNSWTARAVDLVLLQAAVLAIYLFLRRCGLHRAAIAAALLYPIIYVTLGAWMTGLRDLTGAHFLIGAAFFCLPSQRKPHWQAFVAGLLVGYATMIRPTYLGAAPLLFLVGFRSWKTEGIWQWSFVKQGMLYGAGVLVPLVLFGLYGLSTGTLYDWYLDSVRFVVDVYGGLPQSRLLLIPRAVSIVTKLWWWLAIGGAVGTFLWITSGREKAGLWLLAAVAATVVISYFVQNKGFAYHIEGLVPLMLISGCGGAEAGLRAPIRWKSARSISALLIVSLFLAGTAHRLIDARPRAPGWGRQEQTLKLEDTLALAEIIRSESGSNETVLQWGREYQVSFLAERLSGTRFVDTLAVQQVRPGQPIFGLWLTEFSKNLQLHPPKFILVDQSVIVPGTSRLSDAPLTARGSMLDILRRGISTGYVVRAQRSNVTLLKRVDSAPAVASQPQHSF